MNPPTPSWDDSDERTRPSGFGGDWRGSRVSFDDPMSWSLPLFRVAGIAVRLALYWARRMLLPWIAPQYMLPIRTRPFAPQAANKARSCWATSPVTFQAVSLSAPT